MARTTQKAELPAVSTGPLHTGDPPAALQFLRLPFPPGGPAWVTAQIHPRRRRAFLGKNHLAFPRRCAAAIAETTTRITMKSRLLHYAGMPAVAALVMPCGGVQGQTSKFTYCGKLSDAGVTANGPYEIKFGLAGVLHWLRPLDRDPGAAVGQHRSLRSPQPVAKC